MNNSIDLSIRTDTSDLEGQGGADLIICSRKGCELLFEKKTHNMKYCSDECCRLATNSRIMEKYYARRDQRQGKVRHCSECQTTKLSRYNDDSICSACKTSKRVNSNRMILEMINDSVVST